MFDGNVSTTNIAVSTSWKTDKQMPPSPDHVSGFHTLGDESDGYPVSVRSRLSVCTISYLARHVTLPVLPSVPAVARATRSPARTTVYHVPSITGLAWSTAPSHLLLPAAPPKVAL